MDLTPIKQELVARRGNWAPILSHTGLSMSWLSKFANGRITNPGVVTIEKLQAALSATKAPQ